MNNRRQKLNSHARSGVSIFECLVYCFLLCLLASIGFNLLLKTQHFLKKQNSKSNAIVGSWAARDSFLGELRTAPSNKKLWKKITPQEVIWTHDDHDIGWALEKGQLVRYEGSYSESREEWVERTKSVVNSSIKKLDIKVSSRKKHRMEWVSHVVVTCDDRTWNIAIRNGVIS